MAESEEVKVEDMHVSELPPVHLSDDNGETDGPAGAPEPGSEIDDGYVSAQGIANVLTLYRSAGGFITRRPHLWTVDPAATMDLATRLEPKVNNNPLVQKMVGTVDEQSVYFHLAAYLGTPVVMTALEVRAEHAEAAEKARERTDAEANKEVNPIWENQLR